MDAPRGLNDEQADKALRDLFHEAGPLHASVGLDARIMARIAVTRSLGALVNEPLINTRGWWVIAFTMAACITATMFMPMGQGDGPIASLFDRIPFQSAWDALSTSWVAGGVLVGAVLFGLNLWLMRSREREQQRT